MSKNFFFSFTIILAILLLSGCSVKNSTTSESKNNIEKTPKSNSESEKCLDCGEGGWQKMEKKCTGKISDKNDFKNCLMNFSWSVNNEINVENIKEGYIEIGSMESLDNPTADSIKVYIFNSWSVDKDGKLYFLGQLG